jgi:putative transposase
MWDDRSINISTVVGMLNLTYNYKLQPTAKQIEIIEHNLDVCKSVWNHALYKRKLWYNSRSCKINQCSLNSEAEKLGRMRVIVQDNGPIHKCSEVQQLWSQWESQGLYIFFLPKYCSEMNPIELEWQHLKKDELSGRMFEDELELGYAVIDGVTARGERGERGKYRTERVKFNSSSQT